MNLSQFDYSVILVYFNPYIRTSLEMIVLARCNIYQTIERCTSMAISTSELVYPQPRTSLPENSRRACLCEKEWEWYMS